MTGPDIFLSYSRQDVDVAQRFADAFAAEGFDVWWDVALRSGETYDEVLEAALRSAKAVVVLWSPTSVVSRWVRSEATLADRNKTLVPALIAPCDRPIMFELTQTADLCHWQGDDKDSGWRAFLKDVRGFVERGSAPEVTPTPGVSMPVRDDGRPTLAILPFVNRSRDPDDDIFADAMVEDLVAALSTSRTLRVLSSSATRRYRNAAIDPREVGEALGARYLLEGNVRRVGSDIRVTAQIVDSRDGRVHWTQGFERPLAELAVLQEELVVEVASHLNVRLQQIEIERALRKPDSLTAWEYLVRALSLSVSQNQDGIREALEYSRKAVALAPEFGAAHAQLATTAAVNYWQVSGGDDEALRREARDAAHRALELEHDSPPLLTWVAQALCMVGAWNEGLRCAERAVAINPNLEASHAAMIMVSIHFKRAEEALKHIEACERLAPRAPDTHVRLIQRSGAYFLLGRFAEALDAAEQALIFQPAFNIAKKDRAIFLEKLGRREEAIEALCEFRESWPGVTLDQVRLLHQRSLLAPDLATELYETFATVWQAAETPSEVE